MSTNETPFHCDGKDLVTLFKGFKAINSEPVMIGENIESVSNDHIAFLRGTRRDRRPILTEPVWVGRKDLIEPLVNGTFYAVEHVERCGDSYLRIGNEYATYCMPTIMGSRYNAPFLNLPIQVKVDAKVLRKAMSECRKCRPTRIAIHGDRRSGRLFVEAFGEVSIIDSTIINGYDGKDFRTIFPFAYFDRVSRICTGTVTIDLETDFPCSIYWEGGDLLFSALIAPIVERD